MGFNSLSESFVYCYCSVYTGTIIDKSMFTVLSKVSMYTDLRRAAHLIALEDKFTGRSLLISQNKSYDFLLFGHLWLEMQGMDYGLFCQENFCTMYY